MNICYIVCALDCKLDFIPDKTDLVIGADRGYFVLSENNYKADIVIGDFDSYTGDIKCENIIKHPVMKDDTDSALAIEYAISKGYKKIVIYGAIGGALDHTIANISLAPRYIEKGIEIYFVDNENILFGLCNSSISFSKGASGRISVFSYIDKSHGVSESGLLYTIDNVTLENKIALGISNEFIGRESKISVKDGNLLIYTSKENVKKYFKRNF